MCPRCGPSIARTRSDGLCSACLLKAGLQCDYNAVNILGQGPHGTVYLAEQWPSHRFVAMKVFKENSSSSEVVERLRARRLAVAAVGPDAARIYDVGVMAQGTPYVVTEWVRGASIATYCQQSGCDRSTRQRLLDKVSDVIRRSHACGMTHGGIKASNILVAGDGLILKVLDFGVRAAEPADDFAALAVLTAMLL
jgi:eukaryotic-like serine/threonine-protein kinase